MAESDELDELLLPAAVRADALRAAGLRAHLGVVEAQNAALEREQARLSQKLGSEDPRVKAIAQRRQDGQARLRDLGVEVSRAETVVPTVAADEWALHGHVRWPDLSPAPDLTVSLVDARGQWLRALGYACTDARGYFRLVTKVSRSEPDVVSPLPSAYVRVTDSSRKELYRGTDAVATAAGAVEYREIVLDADAARCSSPDESGPAAPPAAPSPAEAPAEAAPGRPRKTRRPS
jgi:hypothetical protein